MKKSYSKESLEDNAHVQNDDEQNEDQQATTSKGAALKAGHTFDNMIDLDPIDFNSADTIRQAMKAILAGRKPPPYVEEVNHSYDERTSASIKINEMARSQFRPMGKYIRSVNPSMNQVRDARNISKQKQKPDNRYIAGPSNFKKRRRSPRAGRPKKMQTISDMYLGKLSNVVPFRRHWQTESDSDMDSAIFY